MAFAQLFPVLHEARDDVQTRIGECSMWILSHSVAYSSLYILRNVFNLQEREQRLPSQTTAESELAGVQDGDEVLPSSPPPPPPPSRSRVSTGPAAAAARGGTAPGEAALREQRERRKARCKERAIDNALEQV